MTPQNGETIDQDDTPWHLTFNTEFLDNSSTTDDIVENTNQDIEDDGIGEDGRRHWIWKRRRSRITNGNNHGISNTTCFLYEDDELDDRVLFLSRPIRLPSNQLVSFPRDTSNTAWLHDEKHQLQHAFYGTSYPSEFQIVTNEDPSATKIYEAFSLEATDGNWSAEFRTDTGDPQ